MLRNSLTALLAGATALLAPLPALAQVIDYTPDGFRDGVSDGIAGDLATPGFELFGTGYVQQGDHLIIGINSNQPFDGVRRPGVSGGAINWGDLFLNFAPEADFETALAAGQVYGVRFNPLNDSPVAIGIYQVTATASVTRINGGFVSVDDYIGRVTSQGQAPFFGTTPMGDRFTYLDRTKSDNVIGAGRLLSTDVEYVADLSTLGFAQDFGFTDTLTETGAFTYGLRFNLDALPLGSFIAHLWAECINDGTSFTGETRESETETSVPEPSLVLGFATIGALVFATGKRRTAG
ncbi:MAG: hypothetical protein IGR92_04610 [Leptolyngbyaceae cyanobacterium T60_A2020_046]|nr:hypothetical protein [Leptolyngbyaceae cyanobacterium T60_A2020_046]